MQNIFIGIKDEKPTIHTHLTSDMQRPGVCEDLLQLLRQRGSPEPDARALHGHPPCYELYAWAVLEAADRLCIITDELPSQQQSWGRG
jgi:hypothetical protein